MEWISVKDRLPEKYDEYLVWPVPNEEHRIISADFQPWDKMWKHSEYDGWGWNDQYTDVTHWMPLPEPPK